MELYHPHPTTLISSPYFLFLSPNTKNKERIICNSVEQVSCLFPVATQPAAYKPLCQLFPNFGKSNHALTIPETHGTTKGAFGCEFLYESGYLSLKLTLGFSACILIGKPRVLDWTESGRKSNVNEQILQFDGRKKIWCQHNEEVG